MREAVYCKRERIIQEDLENIYRARKSWNQLEGKTILITGAYGMLASYVVYFLIYLVEEYKMNIRIILQGRTKEKFVSRYGKWSEKPYISICYSSISEPIKIKDRADYIIHAASLAQPSFYEKNPIEVAEPNAIGTYYLLDYAEKSKVQGFLYFSTGDIYGKLVLNEREIEENTMGRMDPLDMHSCYGESKRMGETWCASFTRERNVPTKIARIWHTYSPTMDLENDPRVFASFVKNVKEGKNITMHSDGSSCRSFCYIADAVVAFFLILLDGQAGEAYNVCNTEQFVSIAELADILAGLRPDLDLKVIREKRNPGELYLEAKLNKADKPVDKKLKELGWTCHYDIKAGFARVLDFFIE